VRNGRSLVEWDKLTHVTAPLAGLGSASNRWFDLYRPIIFARMPTTLLADWRARTHAQMHTPRTLHLPDTEAYGIRLMPAKVKSKTIHVCRLVQTVCLSYPSGKAFLQ